MVATGAVGPKIIEMISPFADHVLAGPFASIEAGLGNVIRQPPVAPHVALRHARADPLMLRREPNGSAPGIISKYPYYQQLSNDNNFVRDNTHLHSSAN